MIELFAYFGIVSVVIVIVGMIALIYSKLKE